jgi:hypothetical protein
VLVLGFGIAAFGFGIQCPVFGFPIAVFGFGIECPVFVHNQNIQSPTLTEALG